MQVCPACGQENPERSRFCGMCGAALAPVAAPPREERKVVTILFTDLVGSTARAEDLDPEDVRATRQAIDYREAPPVEAKGKAEPVKVWEALGARSRFGSDVEEKLRTPLVGRERERDLLADALAHARAEQSAQLVTLVGVPGIG